MLLFLLFLLAGVGAAFLLPPFMSGVALALWQWSRWAEFCVERIYWRPRARGNR
jgi:hypothetical protein